MKFNKAVLINISETALDPSHWRKIDSFVSKRISLPKDSPEIIKEIADADCIFAAFGVPITKEMIDKAPNLKYVGILATAYGKVDVTYAKQKGIIVTNLAGYSTNAVAEFSIAAILESMRQLEEGKQRGRAANYSEAGIKAKEIRGKVFGVIGLGKIGRRVAELAAGFSADVRYWDRGKKDSPFTYVENLDQLIKDSDILSLNLAQTPETEGIINAKRIESLKPGMIFINTVPMECVDVEALANRLAKNDITFILDHSDETPKEHMAKLSKYSNCIIYPPMAYITDEAQKAKKEIFVANIENYLKGTPTNVVS